MTTEIEKLRHELHRLSLYGDWAEKLRVRIQMHKRYSHDKNVRDRTFNLAHIAKLHRCVGSCRMAILVARRAAALNAGKMNSCEATSFMLLACILADCQRFQEAVPIAEHALLIYESHTKRSQEYLAARRSEIERMRREDTGLYLDY